MALTEKKIEIIEAYLRGKCRDKTAAVKEIDPTIKHPRAYAYKLFNEAEVKRYLTERRRELLAAAGLDTEIVVKALSKRMYESLGLAERTVLAHGKNGFDTITGKYADSADTKNYWGILKDILGPEISTVVAAEEINESVKHNLKVSEFDFKKKNEKEKLELEKLKAKLGGDEDDGTDNSLQVEFI